MAECSKCGQSNPENVRFCGFCGAPMEEKAPEGKSCPKCGAKLPDDAKFCGACGAQVGNVRCAVCDAELEPGQAFCYRCGTSSGGRVRREKKPEINVIAPPVERPTSEKTPLIRTVRNAAERFENKYHVILNGIVAVLAVVFLFVALFAPIKVGAVSPDVGNSSGLAEDIQVSQSIYQVLGGFGYLNLDIGDREDRAKIDEAITEYQAAVTRAQREVQEWYKDHVGADDEEIQNKYSEYLADALEDANAFAMSLVITTEGVLDYMTGDDVEKTMIDTLNCMRNTLILSFVMAAFVAFLQIALAVLALVFLVLAIVGMVTKNTKVKPYGVLKLFAWLGGAGMLLLMIGPGLSAVGALFAIALMSVIVYYVLAIGSAVVNEKPLLPTVRNSVFAGIALVAAFLMAGPILSATTEALYANNISSAEAGYTTLGGGIEAILIFAQVGYLRPSGQIIAMKYSAAMLVNAICVLLFGTAAVVLLYVMLMRSLKVLAQTPENTRGNGALLPIFAVVAMLTYVLTAGITAAAGGAPTKLANDQMGMFFALNPAAVSYVSLAFAIVGAVFLLAFRIKDAPAQAPVTATVAGGGYEPISGYEE